MSCDVCLEVCICVSLSFLKMRDARTHVPTKLILVLAKFGFVFVNAEPINFRKSLVPLPAFLVGCALLRSSNFSHTL